MNKILPIGTVIEVSDIPLLVMGYKFVVVESLTEIGYLTEIYPLGFVKEKSILCVPQSKINQVIFEPKQSENAYIQILEKLLVSVQRVGEKEANRILRTWVEEMSV